MRVAFRTEGNHQQGMGDLEGSLALADECVRYGDEVLILISGGVEAIAAIRERGHPYRVVESLAAERQVLESLRPDAIVVNKLGSPPEYVEGLKDFGGLVVTVDDAGEGAKHANLRINVLYPIAGAVTDVEYVALRREFQEAHTLPRRVAEEPMEILVTQGGSDTHGFTPRILRGLEYMKRRPHCTVVVGPAFRHRSELEIALAESTLDLTVVANVRNMAELMLKADLAVTAGGLTMFELACVGTPAVVVCAEPFEDETAARVAAAGAVVNLGFGGDLDYGRLAGVVDDLLGDGEARRGMSTRGLALVDGRGCQRVVHLIRETLTSESGRT